MTDILWLHYARPRPHWYELDAETQATHQAAWTSITEASKSTGARLQGRYHIRGQHDFETVEVWTFASAEAAYDHWARLTAAAYNQWFAFANNVGVGEV